MTQASNVLRRQELDIPATSAQPLTKLQVTDAANAAAVSGSNAASRP